MSSYYSDYETEKALKKLEAQIKREYSKASREMRVTAQNYFIQWEDRYKAEYEKYQNGAYTDAQFKSWVQTQIARGESYEIMANKLAQRAVEADQVASAYINDTTPSIYSLNYNYEAYNINQITGIDFKLVDEQTVKELMLQENHTEFRVTSINPTRDYEWNSKQIHSALTSSILQGKSIDQLADSYMVVMKRDRASAIRNARTSVTSAQNSGRNASYELAKKMGINVQKQWLATLDSRTRDSHAELDGEVVDYDAKFSNGLRYPADPNGSPAEVYNCRCTMVAYLPDFEADLEVEDYDRAYRDENDKTEWNSNGTPKRMRNVTYTGKGTSKSYKDWLKERQETEYSKGIFDVLFANTVDYSASRSIVENLEINGVQKKEVSKLIEKLSEYQIAEKLASVDSTRGACASQAIAYLGNKAGFDVTDYRGGKSLEVMSKGSTWEKIANFEGVESYIEKSKNDIDATHKLLKNINGSGEYVLCTGEHISIIRKANGNIKYLDLQGTKPITEELTDRVLKKRFGCGKSLMTPSESI